MIVIINSYFHYLYSLGLSDIPFNFSYKEVYEELLTLDLTNEVLVKKLISKLNSRMILYGQIGIRKPDIRNHFTVSNILYNKNTNSFGNYKLYVLGHNESKRNLFGKNRNQANDSYFDGSRIILIGKEESEKKEYGIPRNAVQIRNIDNIDKEQKNNLIEVINSEPEFIDFREKTSKTSKQLEKIKRKLLLRKRYGIDQI